MADYLFGRFRLDLAAHRLLRDDEVVPLPAKVLETLIVLVTHRERIVSKDELMRAVWPDTFVSEDSLSHSVFALRRALGDDSAQPRFIATVARRGYRFIAPVSEGMVPGGEATRPAVVQERDPAVVHPAVGAAPAQRRFRWAPLALALAIVLALVGIGQPLRNGGSNAVTPRVRFTPDLPPGIAVASGGNLAPDGNHLALIALDNATGDTALWLHSLETAETRRVPGSEGAHSPFWSPDSRSIGFFGGGRLKRVGIGSEPPRTVSATVAGRTRGGTWNAQDLILFSDAGGRLYTVPAAGGNPSPIPLSAAVGGGTQLHLPTFLPDGQRFLYTASSTDPDVAGTYIGTLTSTESVRLLDASYQVVTYAPPGHLVYVRDRVLMAQGFDPISLRLDGNPIALAGNASSNAGLSASRNGLLAFGAGDRLERLTWFDRSGRRLGVVNVPTALRNMDLSPDETQLVGESVELDREGIWIVDLERNVPTRAVPHGTFPIWAPDGRSILYSSGRVPRRPAGLYSRVNGASDDTLVLATKTSALVNDWSPDGRYIVYVTSNGGTKPDVWLLPQGESAEPVLFLRTHGRDIQAQVSPDGRWIAYASDESGTPEVYVQSFPAPSSKRTISSGGGTQPQWRRDGRELFYLSVDHVLMSVEVDPGETLHVESPKPLFRAPVFGGLSDYRNHYTPTRDGQRFLIGSIDPAASDNAVTVLVNWLPRS